MRFFSALTLALCSLIFTAFNSQAQSKIGTVKGIVTDAAQKPLISATVNVLDAKDSSLAGFARSKDNGSFEVIKLDAGNYFLTITYTGYQKIQKPFSISAASPLADLGSFMMKENSNTLADVVITAPPVVIKGDTIEYNAASFKVNKPNAVVEDLLKKLPGIEVDKDGVIKANGQEVKRVMVDGKMFFANDPKLATKNLQVDMVNKVQVFDKKNDKSEFTGFDDGNSEPTINLTLKADKRNGVFGKVSGGYGTDDRYQSNANINLFKKGEQISFIGQANNVNQQGFSVMDALSFSGGKGAGNFGGGGGQGITATKAAGLNYNNFKNSKLDFTSSYFFNATETQNNYKTRRQTFTGDSTQLYSDEGSTNRNNYNHRINLGLDWKIDSFNSIKITPSISYQITNNFGNKTYNTNSSKGTLMSEGLNNNFNHNEGYNFSTSALWRHRFAKKGRTFSTELRVGRNENNGDGTLFTVLNGYQRNGEWKDSTLDQHNSTNAAANSYSVNMSYTEPVSRRAIIEFNAYRNHNDNTSDKDAYDYNPATGQYDLPNFAFTNHFDNDYNTLGGGINFRENRTGWNYAFGGGIQQSELSSWLKGKNDRMTQQFINFMPNAQLQIGKNRYKNFRLRYNGTTSQPSINQLQPVPNVTDPTNTIIGNPDLKQSFTNNVRVNYNIFDPYTNHNFFANLNFSNTFNDIVNNDSLKTNGFRTTQYLNANGNWNASGNVNIGMPLVKGSNDAKINFTTGASYSHNISYLNNAPNEIKNINVTQRVSVNYTYKELMDFSIGGGVNWSRARYSLQARQNTNFYTYTGSLDANLYLPKNFTMGSSVDFNANTGRAAGYNTRYTLWNASLGKQFLKNKKGELKLIAYDLLNQNTGISRNTSGSFVEDKIFTVLKRYFMLTFTYSLSKFGQMQGGRGGDRIMLRSMQ